MDNDELRKFYQPDKVKIFFVGESPPAGKTFFYAANSNLFRATLAGFQLAFPEIARDDFFRSFKEMGCYLVDLCDQPVNKLTNPEKKENQSGRHSHLEPGDQRSKTRSHPGCQQGHSCLL